MSKGLTWTTGKVKLADLVDYEKNPVHISERALKELAKSLQKYGHIIPYTAAAPKNGSKVPILDGHQRKRAEIEILGIDPKTVVEVRYPSRKLSEKERQEIIVRLRKNTGEFDFDKLEEFFPADDLLKYGFQEWELRLQGFEIGEEQDPSKEWEGMPEFENSEKAVKSLYIHFKTMGAYEDFCRLIGQSLTDKTRSTWYPRAPEKELKSVVFDNES